MTDAEDLERRLARVEQTLAKLTDPSSSATGRTHRERAGDEDTFWVLNGVEDRYPDGAVVLAGSVEGGEGGRVRWQYGLTAERLRGIDWTDLSPALDALGNPVRLALLRSVLDGLSTTAELAGQESLGTTGQLHHHLRILIGAGWLASAGRGRYQIPPTRVIPLLVIILAARPA